MDRDDLIALGMWALATAFAMVVLGVRMDTLFLTFAPHLPDLDLLEHHLLQTVVYEHTQPPLYPLLVGVLLKVSPFSVTTTFTAANLAMGAATAVVMRRILAMLGLRRVLVFVALALILTNPALIAIEFVASYDQPSILLLALVIWRSGRYVQRGTGRDLAWALGLGAALVLLRTVFHPVWFVLFAAGLLAMRAPALDRRRLAATIALPLIVIGAFIAKSAVLYGTPTLTTFDGASIAKIAGAATTPDQRDELIAEGTVSPLFGRPVFWGYATYEDAMPPCRSQYPDVPVLTQQDRSVGGYPNMNSECMLAVYEQQGKDGRAFLLARPQRFAATQLGGAQMFFEPSLPIIFTSNDWRLRGMDRVYRSTIFPTIDLQPVTYSEFGALRVLDRGGILLEPTTVLLDVAAIGLGLSAAWRLAQRRTKTSRSAARAKAGTWAAVGLACAWVTVVGSLFEINENARYRVLIQPYLLATLVYLGQLLWTSMSKPMSSTDAELVSDPDDTTSAPVSA